MKLTRCSNGHFFDADKYTSCPHCGNSGGDQTGGSTVPFESNISSTQPMGQPDVVTIPQGGMGHVGGDDSVTIPGTGYGGIDPTIPVDNRPQFGGPDDDDPKTIGYEWGAEVRPGAATPPAASSPVVGWLVCVEGPSFGTAYNLYYGKNFIGRARNMDVCLESDKSVSRNRHAVVVYEPKQRLFYVQPGDSHELFYCNEEVVLSSIRLMDRAVILIGKTKLIFVPFCNATFGWE